MFIKYIILYVYINLLCSLKIPKVSQISNVRKNMFYNLNVDQIIFDLNIQNIYELILVYY